MAKILVGTYGSRRDADDARQQLLERGFNNSQISVEGPGADESRAAGAAVGAAAPDAFATGARGLRGVIARMFSDLFPDKADHARYAHAVRSGSTLVAVHGLDEADAARAKQILEQAGVVDEHVPAAAQAEAWSPRRPDETALPNAPTGWNEATEGERSTIGRRPNDPARPEGATRGANGLGATLDRERVQRKP